MPALKNSRHEKFALALFKGMSQKDAAIQAGYLYNNENTIKSTASRLLTYVNITERIAELHEEAKTPAVMSVIERKERLSEIGRADLINFVVDGEPELTKDTPNKGAAAEFYKKHSFTKRGDPVITKTIRLHNPITAIAELNKMEGEYPATKIDLDWGLPFKELLNRLYGYRPALKEGQVIVEEAEAEEG